MTGNQMQVINQVLRSFKEEGMYPELPLIETCGTNPHVKIGGKDLLMFGSNNYLGIANNKRVISRALEILREHGLGPGGSRILCGNIELIDRFEKKLAEFIGVEETITFPTGYMANLAIFQAMMGPFINPKAIEYEARGVIFSDEYNHATIIDGCRLTSAKKVVYKHNDLSDLRKKVDENEEIKYRLVVTESVYSTEGTLTDVPAMLKLAEETESILMVDDAHGIGVIGKNGRGVISRFSFGDRKPDIVMASFDKALGTMGGFLGGSHKLIEYLRIASRPYIFSSAIPAVIAAGTHAVIDELEGHPELVERANSNAEFVRDSLKRSGFRVMGNGQTPAVPIYIGNDKLGIHFSNSLFEEGVYVPCFRWPAAPAGMSRLRISVMASHSQKDLEDFVEKVESVGKRLKIVN